MHTIKQMQISDYCTHLSKNIKVLLTLHNWTLKSLAEKSNVPYNTLTKIVNNTDSNPSLSTLVKLSNAFHCNIDTLINAQSPSQLVLDPIPSHLYASFYYMINFVHIQKNNPAHIKDKFVPLYSPFCESSNSFQYHFSKLDSIDVSSHQERYLDQISYAIRITHSNYHPIYFEHDIILFGTSRPPKYGEIGLFSHNNKLYLRQYFPGSPIRLVSINDVESPIILSNLNNWHLLGYVIALYS